MGQQRLKQYLRKIGHRVPHRIRKLSIFRTLYKKAMLFREPDACFKNIDFPNGEEFKLYLDLSERPDRKIFLGNNYEINDVQVFLSLVETGDTVFDLGGYIGYYSILASRLVGETGKVITFEAHPYNYERIVGSVEHNHIGNVSVENLAVSDVLGSTIVHVSSNAATHSLAEETDDFFLGDHTQTGDRIKVPSTTLDSYTKESNLYPDIIKIDVEGAELDVLHGGLSLINNYQPKILLSVHEQKLSAFDSTPNQLYTFLNEADIELSLVTSQGPIPLDSRPQDPQYTLLLH